MRQGAARATGFLLEPRLTRRNTLPVRSQPKRTAMRRIFNFSAGPAVLPEEVLQQAAAEMLDAMAAGQREIVVAQGVERQMGELTRTPDALFDQVAAMMARGYAAQLKAKQ